MIKKKLIMLSVLILFCTSLIFPQNNDYKIIQLPKEQGAATDLVYKMIVDKKGFLWLGTMFGLVKYDGKNYHIYNNDPFDSTTIGYDDIIFIYEDKDGFLWVSTWANGINRFSQNTEKFERYFYNPDDSSSISSNTTSVISQDNWGNIWVASQNGVLNKYLKQKNSFKRFLIPKSVLRNEHSGPNVITFLLPEENDLIICYRGEVIKFVSASENFTQFFSESEAAELNGKFVNLIYKDSKRNYWIGTNQGLFKYSPGKKLQRINFIGNATIPAVYANNIREIREDSNGNLWIGTAIGLNKLNEDGNSFSFFSNETNKDRIYIDYDVNNIAVDRGGIIWVSSYRRGLYKIFKDNDMFENILITTNEPQSQNYTIKNIIEDNNGNIFAGSFGRGLLKLNKMTGSLENVPTADIQFQNINALALEEDNLWIGSNSGLRLYNFSKQKFEKFSFQNDSLKSFDGIPVSSLLIDSKERLWVGTATHGVYVINKKRTDVEFINLQKYSSLPSTYQYHSILNISKDGDNNIWIGTFGGLFKYSQTNGSVKHFYYDSNNRKSLSNNYIFAFCEDKSGFVWIGTANGLNKYDNQKNEFIKYYRSNGLLSSVINGIAEDGNNNLWLSTNKGVSKFNLTKNEFYNFDLKDGISANSSIQNAYFKGSDNKIYFGGRGGLIIIDPEFSDKSSYSPPIYITSFSFGNNSGKQTKLYGSFNDIKINHGENFINIDFIALDYTYPELVNYEYKLEGFDGDWIFPGNNNSAQYKNLPPGEYKFLLRATNRNGLLSKTTAELNFAILPPFWSTWWFITLSLVFFCVSVYAVYKWAVKIKINRAVEIERIKLNERELLKRKTAVDFHDEVGYRLTKISILSELIKRKIPESMGSIEAQLINITEISNEIYTGTKDFIWSIDPKNDSVYELFIRLKDFGDEFFNGSKIDFKTDGFNEDLKNYYLSSDWKRHLTLLFKEAMNNSLKHSCANQVILRVSVLGKKLKIEIADNGKGFIKTEASAGSGLKNMISRAEKINGIIEIEPAQGAGTKVVFTADLLENKL